MGIRNVQFLIQLDDDRSIRMAQQAKAVLEEKLMVAHRQGQHPYGEMRRECPLCQAGK
jgi:hypothetical protein